MIIGAPLNGCCLLLEDWLRACGGTTTLGVAHVNVCVSTPDVKTRKFRSLTSQASVAASSYDLRTLYGVIRHLRPKQPRHLIRFRDSAGLALSPREDLMVLREHYQHVFCVPRPPVPALPCERLQDMSFSVEELAHAFAKVRLHKSCRPSLAAAGSGEGLV